MLKALQVKSPACPEPDEGSFLLIRKFGRVATTNLFGVEPGSVKPLQTSLKGPPRRYFMKALYT